MLPRVTILTPTCRPGFLAQCAKYIARQTYPKERLEWVIVNSGEDFRGFDWMPDMATHILTQSGPVGALRNAGLRVSTGELVVHFDDDDWHASDRIERQVAPFLVRPYIDLVCTDNFYVALFNESPMRAMRSWAWDLELFSAGGTFMYRRKAWQKHPFANVPSAEDYLFAKAIRSVNAQAGLNMRDPGLFICVRHGGNTTNFDEDYRARATLQEGAWVRTLMGHSDFEAIRNLVENVTPPFDDQADHFERPTQKQGV